MKKYMQASLKNCYMEKETTLFDEFFKQINTLSEDQWLEKAIKEGRKYSNTLKDIPKHKSYKIELGKRTSSSRSA